MGTMFKSFVDNIPDGGVAFGICNASGVAFFHDITVYVLHEEIRSQDSIYEVSADVTIIKVVLK